MSILDPAGLFVEYDWAIIFQAHSISIILHHSTAYYIRIFPKWSLDSVVSIKNIDCFEALKFIEIYMYGYFIDLWIRAWTSS